MARIVAAASVAAPVLAFAPAAAADNPPPSLVMSRWETAAEHNIVSRDCGFSVPVPNSANEALWLFCDSAWSGTSEGFWLGTTAAVGPYTAGRVPTGLTEIPTPPAAIGAPSARPPAGFLPLPPVGRLPDGAQCAVPGESYTASWITGAARQPSGANPNRVLISYTDVCVHPEGIPAQRYGLAEYDPATNTVSGQTRVFTSPDDLPFQRVLGSPIFDGGHLYLVGYTCDSNAFGACGSGRVVMARVGATPAQWRNPNAYRWWNGSGWVSDHGAAVSILPGARAIHAHAEDFRALGKGFVIVEQTDIGGTYRIWRSDSLTGGWSVTRTGTVPCGDQTGMDLCRAYFGHPALSTDSQLLMSYYNPGIDHVAVRGIPW